MIFFYYLVTQLPLDQDPTWEKFVGTATAIKYLGFVCVLYAILHLTIRGKFPRYLAAPQAPIFLIFFSINFVSYWTMGAHFSIRTSPFMIELSMASLFFVVLSVVDNFPRLRWTLLAAVAALGWASLFVIREWVGDPGSRPGWIVGDANYFAQDACLVLPVMFLFMVRSRVRWERFFVLGCMVVTVVAAMLGGSRGGMFAICAACLWLIWHSPNRVRNTAILVVLLIPPLVLSPFSPIQRLIHPKYSDENGEQARIIAWRAGMRMVQQHPLFGIGLGEFKPQMLKYADPGVHFRSIAHETYLEVAAETGLPNLVVFLAMLLFTYLSLGRVRRRAADSGPPVLYMAATGLQAGLVGFCVGAFFLSAEYLKLFWLWIFLSMVLPSFLPQGKGKRGRHDEPAESPTKATPENTAVLVT